MRLVFEEGGDHCMAREELREPANRTPRDALVFGLDLGVGRLKALEHMIPPLFGRLLRHLSLKVE